MGTITELFLRVFVYTFLGLMSANALAQVMTESPDAGNTPATASMVIPGTTQINGTVGPDAIDALTGRDEPDVDMYSFVLDAGDTFTIQVNAAIEDEPDMNLMVFNESGQFLAGDDDDGDSCANIVPFIGEYDSCLTLNLPAGAYYFAVGDNNIGAFETVAEFVASRRNYFENNDSGILVSPSAEIVAIAGSQSAPSSSDERGAYSVYFSTAVNGGGSPPAPSGPAAPIPTMSVYGLMLTTLGLLLVARRRLRISASSK